jgi:hypothetical protein
MTDSRAPRLTASRRLGAGVIVVLLALVCFGSSRVVAGGQRHAYNPRATPPPTYHLIGGKIYQLSAAAGLSTLTKTGVLGPGITPSCFWSTDGGTVNEVQIVSTKDDERNVHVFATFQVPSTGDFHISCQGIKEVFVDDAEDAGRDLSALLLVIATILGLVGFAAAMSGGYELVSSPTEESFGEDDEVDSLPTPLD